MLDLIKKHTPRMSLWIALTIGLLILLYIVKPAAMAGTIYKLLLFAAAMVTAYFGDRAFYSQLSDRIAGKVPRDSVSAARILSRAIIFLGAALLFGLGV